MADYQALTLFRVRMDRCAEMNGVGPCGALVDCANTWYTCDFRCAFNCTVTEHWFTTCDIPIGLAIRLGIQQYSPCITSCSHVPTKIETGKSFSRRATWSVCIQDKECGSLPSIGDLIDTYKYVEGLPVEIFTGDDKMGSLCEFDCAQGVIRSYSLNTRRGGCEYCLKIGDPLDLTSRAACPAKTITDASGNPISLTLAVDLDGAPTDDQPEADPFAEVNQNLLLSGIPSNPNNDACFSELRYLCRSNEILRVYGDLDPVTGWNAKLLDRAQCGSTLGPRRMGESLTVPMVFKDMHIVDIICRLLLECADLEAALHLCCEDEPERIIDWENFEEYRCKNPLFQVRDDVIICTPEDANKLLDELAQTFLFSLFYDSKRIRISDPCPPEVNNPAFILTEDDIIKNSVSVGTNDNFANQVNINHDTTDWTKKTDFENTSSTTSFFSADSLLEPCERREHKSVKQLNIDSRWIGPSTGFLAHSQARRWRILRECAPRELCLQVLTRKGKGLPLGDYGVVDHPKTRRWDGSNVLWRLTSKQFRHDDICMDLCFEQSPFDGDELPCFSCDAKFPATVDECGQECFEVW